jgi:hypothetical protein
MAGWWRGDVAEQLSMLKFIEIVWPHYRLYNKQVEIVQAVEECDEVFVPAGNMLGKDFIAALICLAFFLTRHPCRVVTTSADFSQLCAVLWGELNRHIQEARYPLTVDKGGILIVNQLHVRKLVPMRGEDGEYLESVSQEAWNPFQRRQPLMVVDALSYIIGRVAMKGEGLLGHHIAETGDGIPRTLFTIDEASGVDDVAYERGTTWARRVLCIGNPFPSSNTFWQKACQGGDITAEDAEVYKAVQKPGEDFRVKGIH